MTLKLSLKIKILPKKKSSIKLFVLAFTALVFQTRVRATSAMVIGLALFVKFLRQSQKQLKWMRLTSKFSSPSRSPINAQMKGHQFLSLRKL